MGSSIVGIYLFLDDLLVFLLHQVLAFSRQAFAFSRDGALPFSSYMYRINSYTKTPVNSEFM